jgi:hypothetical protein
MIGDDALKAGRKDLAQFTEWVVYDVINFESVEKYTFMLTILLIVLKSHCMIPQQ